MLSAQTKKEVPSDFDAVAPTYDLLTGMNPGYNSHLRLSARRMALPRDARVLDLCCGTGLSTEAIVEIYPDATVTGLDASEGMLAGARSKKWPQRVDFVHGDAMDPGASQGVKGPYDGILMAYGIRNVPDADVALDRIFQLLKPGGVICFHEYSVADSMRSRAIWNAVTCGIIIPGGLITARSSKIYRYLRSSVLEFDGVRAFCARLRRHGFVDVREETVDGWQRDIVHSFLAKRPLDA